MFDGLFPTNFNTQIGSTTVSILQPFVGTVSTPGPIGLILGIFTAAALIGILLSSFMHHK